MFGPRRVFQSRLHSLTTRVPPASRCTLQVSRHASTIAQASTPERTKWPRRLVYAGIFGFLGASVGKLVNDKVTAPAEPDSPEDLTALGEILRVYENGLPIVQRLRSNPDYEETDVYGNYGDDHKANRLTSGPLRGSRGLAHQKVFWNDKEKKSVSVVFLGPGLEGWPGMVHGGALATVIDENVGRVAVRHFPEKTGVTANLEINYRAPVYSGNFYSIHATLDTERSTDRKGYVTGEVRDPTGRLCAEASGLFVVPKQYKLQRIGDKF
ncbi:HotDog domain-containing protein [Aspergillus floccosus]